MPKSKKPKLRDLSRVLPTREERDAALDTFIAGPPIIVAVLGLALVEYELDRLLRSRFPDLSDATWDDMTGDKGPFGTMYAKIIGGRAYRLYDDATRDHLNLIRNIRNQFAHAKRLLSFDDPLIVRELRNVPMPPRPHSGYAKRIGWVRDDTTKPKDAFQILCLTVQGALQQRYIRSLRATVNNMKRTRRQKPMTSNPFFGHARPGLTVSSLGLLAPSHTDGPSPLAPEARIAIALAKSLQANDEGGKDD